MSSTHASRVVAYASLALLVVYSACSGAIAYGAPPVELVLTGHVGWEVDKTTKGKVCTVVSKDECQAGKVSAQPGGFTYPDEGIAASSSGAVYIADGGNHRVQEFEPDGQFVLMFGKEVNATKAAEFHEPGNPHGVTEAEEDVCTAASGDTCKAGVSGSSSDALSEPQSIAVAPGTNDVYIADRSNRRVDKYTASGEFVLAVEDANCGFEFEVGPGNLLTVGGPSEDLYVGDMNGIHTINSSGECTAEIKSSPVTAIAADSTTLYVVENFQPVVHLLDASSGNPTGELKVPPSRAGATTSIRSMALDSAGHLAISGGEQLINTETTYGRLYEASTLEITTYFAVPEYLLRGLAFDGSGEMFAAVNFPPEILTYKPVPVAELVTLTGYCIVGSVAESDASVSLDCPLTADVNPEGVSETEVWFEWGRTEELGSVTPRQLICTTVCPVAPIEVSYIVKGVRPGEGAFYYRLRGTDANVSFQEALTSKLPVASFSTPTVPPRVLGQPTASFVKSTSAVLSGELNPEGTSTTYGFQYALARECEKRERELGHQISVAECPGKHETGALHSAIYGRIDVTGEASGLLPNTVYRDQMYASNKFGEQGLNGTGQPALAEGSFTTSASPVVSAETGAASFIGATTATVSGTVNPDNQMTTYSFEVGVYNGDATQYFVAATGAVNGSTTPVVEEAQLSGLQPNTVYAYRIAVRFGNGTTVGSSAIGAPKTFMTSSLAAVIGVPPAQELLAVPAIQFPRVAPRIRCKHGQLPDFHGKCAKHKKARRRNSKAHHIDGHGKPIHKKRH